MHYFWLHVILIAQFFTLPFTKSYGELIMTRYHSNNTNEYSYKCITANDGSALDWSMETYGAVSEHKPDLRRHVCVGVVLGSLKNCISETDISGEFKKVLSIDYPMDPVFDYRWEGFEETNSSYTLNVENTTTVVFSARTCETFEVRFTENNSTSVIFPLPMSEHCGNRKNGSNAEPVLKSFDNPIKWRTYIIKWNERYKMHLFENGTTKKYSYDLNETSSEITEMHFDIPNITRLRVHRYIYFLTNKTGSKLRLMNFSEPMNPQFCVHLVISLCEECQFEVHIVDSTGHRLRHETFSRKGSTNTGLPFWQIETLKVSVKTNTTRPPTVILLTKTTKKGNITDGRWALGGIPYCELQNTMGAQDDSWHTDLIVKKIDDQKLPKVFCEKLFYTENLVVNCEANITNAVSKVARPIPKSYCDSAPDHCKSMIICNPSNCNCAPGFDGTNCDQECPKGNYGYGCQDTCQYCFSKSCDNIMGKCNSNCTENRVFPYCKKSLRIPKIGDFNDTWAELRWDSSLDKEERQGFRIEFNNGVGDNRSVPIGSENETRLADLVPCSTYEVRLAVGIPKHGISRSHEVYFTTRWNPPTNLTVTGEKLGCIKLNWLHNSSNIKQPMFNVSYEQFSTTLKGKITSRSARLHKDNRTAPTYAVDLCLLTASEYILTVTAMGDKPEECGRASAEKTYYIPPRPSFGEAELQVSRSDLHSIELIIPPVMNDTTMSIISVDVIAKPNCSISNIRSYDWERVSKSANETGTEPISVTMLGNGSIILIIKTDTELCQLLPNESYDVNVTVSDGRSRQSLSGRIESLDSYLKLTIGIGLASVICVMFVVFLMKYKFVRSKPVLHDSDEQIQTTTIPYKSLHSQYAREEKPKTFEKEIRKSVENGVMLQQFRELPRGLVRPCKIGILPKNRSKNRYENFIAYDDTRVILGGGCSSDDYINANYIHGYCKEKAYIATQAPIPETVDDFWRMIWQEEVTVICMLVDVHDCDKKICEQYWPKNVKARQNYGEYAVCNMEERVYANFIHRSLLMVTCYDEKSRMIEHLQYTEWSDDEVPISSHSVVEYLKELRSIHTRGGPVVVHCSSGAERTGTIILCDISSRHIVDKGTVDIFAEARKMFEARANMLSTFKQFVLTHVVAAQYLLPSPTNIPCGEITKEKVEQFKNDIPMLMSRLEDCSWMDKSMYCLDPVKPPAYENISKNRFRKLTPVSSRLVILQCYPSHDIHSDYISAVSVDGVNGKRYITSQLPLPSTRTDFWRLIIEKKVRVIVILQRPDPENNDSCCDVVPRGTLIPIPKVTVKTESSSNANKFFTMDTLSLTNASTVPVSKRKIVALTCENWSLDEDARPPEPKALVELWIAVKRTWRCGPILVLCYDGVKGCGLYVAMSYMLDRMSSDRECDIISATRAVQRSRQEFMTEQWQFEYLCDAALQHVKAFKTYANVS